MHHTSGRQRRIYRTMHGRCDRVLPPGCYAPLLACVLREYDGSGLSRAVLRDLQAAAWAYDLLPVVEAAAQRLMEMISHVVSRHNPDNESMLQLLEQLGTATMQTQPFNGVMTFPERHTPIQPVIGAIHAPFASGRSYMRRPWARFQAILYGHRRQTRQEWQRHLMCVSHSTVPIVDGISGRHCVLVAAYALRDTQPITAILPSQLPAPVQKLAARELRRFLSEAELYEQ